MCKKNIFHGQDGVEDKLLANIVRKVMQTFGNSPKLYTVQYSMLSTQLDIKFYFNSEISICMPLLYIVLYTVKK
jgi:hypothetical protein